MTTKLSQRCCALSWLLAGIVVVAATRQPSAQVLAPTAGVPKDFPASIGRSYVAIFEKAR